MYFLIFALIAGAFGYVVSDGGIGDVPFAQLTLNKVFRALFTSIFYMGALFFLFKSLASDGIWPWRWQVIKDISAWLGRRKSINQLKQEINHLEQEIKRRQQLGYENKELMDRLNELTRRKVELASE